MTKPLCIYHANCADGITAAYIVDRHVEGGVELHAGTYGEAPPIEKARGRLVYMVDFSYPRAAMKQLVPATGAFVWIDHHKSAIDDMVDFPWRLGVLVGVDTVFTDLQRSGAGLAWDLLNPHLPRPLFVDLVEDRDLWRFKFPQTRAFNMGLFAHPMTLETVDAYFLRVTDLLRIGEPILKHHDEQVRRAVLGAGYIELGGYVAACANVPPALSSDTGNKLLEKFPKAPFSVTWYWDANPTVTDPSGAFRYSLRSEDSRVDVSVIAKQYGGGGHRNAAGFTLPFLLPCFTVKHWDTYFRGEQDPRPSTLGGVEARG